MADADPAAPPGHSSRPHVLAAFAAVYLVWGSTYLGIRVGIATIPPFLMAGTRFLIAGGSLNSDGVVSLGPAETIIGFGAIQSSFIGETSSLIRLSGGDLIVGVEIVGETAAEVDAGKCGGVPGVGGLHGAGLGGVAAVGVEGGGAEEVDVVPGATLGAVDGACPSMRHVRRAIDPSALDELG